MDGGRRPSILALITVQAQPMFPVAGLKKKAIAFVCLFSFLVQVTGVLPCLLGLLACLDGSHTVRVQCSDSAWGLRLTHETATGYARSPDAGIRRSHHHGFGASVACFFAESNDNDPDHLLRFASSAATEEAKRMNVKRSVDSALSAALASDIVTRRDSRSVTWIPLAGVPPPGSPSAVQFLRSVSLLI